MSPDHKFHPIPNKNFHRTQKVRTKAS